MIRYDIDSTKRNGYLPISLEKLKAENTYLYNVLAEPWAETNSHISNSDQTKSDKISDPA